MNVRQTYFQAIWDNSFRKTLVFVLLLSFSFIQAIGAEISIEGDTYEFDNNTGIYIYQNPRLDMQGEKITARRLTYDSRKKTIEATGNITFFLKKQLITGERIFYDLNKNTLTIYRATLLDKSADYFVTAEKIERIEKGKLILHDAVFTQCNPESPAWEVSTSYVVYYEDDYAYAWNTAFWMYNVPLMYTPFVAWTTKHQRGTGLLPPKYSYYQSSNPDKRLGHRLQVPLFLDMAKYHDLTLTADLIEERGAGIGLEYNYAYTQGMLGQLRHWRIQESQPKKSQDKRDPAYYSEKGDRPYRFNTALQHRQPIFFNGELFLEYLENSDNEVNKEYFESSVVNDWNWKRSANAIFSWESGGLSLRADQGAQFLNESVKDKTNDADTHLNQIPAINIEQNFSQIADLPLSINLNGNAVQFNRRFGWEGTRSIGTIESDMPFNIDFLNIIPQWSRKFSHYQVQYNYNTKTHEESSAEFENERTGNASWKQDRKSLETNFEVYRLFRDEHNIATGRLSFRPRLIFEEIEDVDQRRGLSTTPTNYSMSMTPADYTQHTSLFDGNDRQLGKKTFTLRLDTEYLSKDPRNHKIDSLFKFSLIQIHNLNRKKTIEETEESFVGPQIPEEYQETKLGNQMMPLRISLTLTPKAGFSGNMLYRYDHELNKIIDSKIQLKIVLNKVNTLSLSYRHNTKAYQELDGALEPLSHNYTLDNNMQVSEKFSFSLGGVWDFTRSTGKNPNDDVERLDRKMIESKAGFLYLHDCYTLGFNYQESIEIVRGENVKHEIVEREVPERKITLSFSLSNFGAQKKLFLQ